jgi:hypothetical protein
MSVVIDGTAGITTPGPLTMTSGGITFNANPGGGTQATLNDYEEGTWTPNVYNSSSSSTWTTKIGYYRKIGKQVTIWFACDNGNSGTSGSTLVLVGIPFNVPSFASSAISYGIWGANGLPTSTGNIFISSGGGNTFTISSGGGAPTAQATYISGMATYYTNS